MISFLVAFSLAGELWRHYGGHRNQVQREEDRRQYRRGKAEAIGNKKGQREEDRRLSRTVQDGRRKG